MQPKQAKKRQKNEKQRESPEQKRTMGFSLN